MSKALPPLELLPRDLSAYRAGNVGIDHVHRFESGVPGPHVLINALTHGNEICGAIALEVLELRQAVKDFGPGVWVTGYANDVMAYIPSRRLWEEGGYQAGAFDVYGLPATRWCADIEERITSAVARCVAK